MKTIYVGNIPFSSTEEDIRTLFEQFGSVASVKRIRDRVTGRLRGFGFVEIEETKAADAIEKLNESTDDCRVLRVSQDHERIPKQPRKPEPESNEN